MAASAGTRPIQPNEVPEAGTHPTEIDYFIRHHNSPPTMRRSHYLARVIAGQEKSVQFLENEAGQKMYLNNLATHERLHAENPEEKGRIAVNTYGEMFLAAQTILKDEMNLEGKTTDELKATGLI
jgi:hypothetical protein